MVVPLLLAELTVNGRYVNYNVHGRSIVFPGDRVKLSASENSNGTVVSFVNDTRSVTRTLSGTGRTDLSYGGIAVGSWVSPTGATEGVRISAR